MDSLTLAAEGRELAAELAGARVGRVDQPARHRIFIEFERARQRLGLLIAADPQLPRIHLTSRRPARPQSARAFMQLLRKYLEGCRLVDVTQPNLDRLLHLHFSGHSAIGEPWQLVLAAEIMGKYSNIILFRSEDSLILGSLQVVDELQSDRRWIAPGERYTLPVVGDKPLWFALRREQEVADALLGVPPQLRCPKALSGRIGGLSKAGWSYVLALAGSEPSASRLAAALTRLREIVGQGLFVPHWTEAGYSVLPPPHGDTRPIPISALLEDYYDGAERQATENRLRRELGAILIRELERCGKKMALYDQKIAAIAEAETWRHLGDLLMANLHLVPPHRDIILVEDYAQPGASVTITLDPEATPAANAQAYYRRYRKAMNAARQAETLLTQCRREQVYLEQVQLDLDLAEQLEDLEAIRTEMAREGVGRPPDAAPQPRARGGTRARPDASELLQFRSSQGLTMLAGKNNRQNDYLTLKLAQPRDIWVHTQLIPGAHVIIRTEGGRRPVPAATLAEAAQIGAYYSRARLSSNVPVVYTECRYVSKPRGARPGMVIYEQEKTLFVTPDAAVVSALRVLPEG